MFVVKKSLLLLLCDNNLFCASFPAKIIIGNVQNGKFVQNQYFEFDKRDIAHLTHSIVSIVRTIANTKSEKGILIEKDDNLHYIWSYESPLKTLYLLIEKSSEITFKIPFSLEEFNDLISILSFLILPSLCLNNNAIELFHFVSDCPIEDITPIKTFQNYLIYLKCKKYSLPNSHLCSYLLHYNDILISLMRLKSLYNRDLKNHCKDCERE